MASNFTFVSMEAPISIIIYQIIIADYQSITTKPYYDLCTTFQTQTYP
jgi:hypothetical protein